MIDQWWDDENGVGDEVANNSNIKSRVMANNGLPHMPCLTWDQNEKTKNRSRASNNAHSRPKTQ